jgi:hypothetical protein
VITVSIDPAMVNGSACNHRRLTATWRKCAQMPEMLHMSESICCAKPSVPVRAPVYDALTVSATELSPVEDIKCRWPPPCATKCEHKGTHTVALLILGFCRPFHAIAQTNANNTASACLETDAVAA